MRILFVNDYGVVAGGVETFGLGLASALREAGHEVRWFTSRSQGGGKLACSTDFFHDDYFCQGQSKDDRWRRAAFQLFNGDALKQLKRALREWSPDIVHLHAFLGQLSPAVLNPLRAYPVVMQLHTYKNICPKGNLWKHNRSHCEASFDRNCLTSECLTKVEYFHEWTKRKCYRNFGSEATFITCPSRFAASTTSKATSLPVLHFPYAITTAQWSAPKVKAWNELLYVGRLAPEKGVETLLHAISLMKDTALSLTLIGDGPLRAGLITLAENLKITSRVRFLGHQSSQKIARQLQTAEALVVPSLWPEVSGIVALEALASGTPVVATKVGGLSELVTSDVGVLVPPGSPAALAEGIQQLLARDRNQSLEPACREHAKRFDFTQLLPSWLRVYHTVIERARRVSIESTALSEKSFRWFS